MNVSPLALTDAPLLHALYNATPGYFELLGNPVPTRQEVQQDVQIALLDPSRRVELLRDSSGDLIGCLDYKMDFPQVGDVTLNLVLIRQDRQSRGYGEEAVLDLERRLPSGTQRVLAGVLGANPRGARFWERLGYVFALDARPVMTWYAKTLRPVQPTLPVAPTEPNRPPLAS